MYNYIVIYLEAKKRKQFSHTVAHDGVRCWSNTKLHFLLYQEFLMMCIGKVKQWCVHIAILPAQGAPRTKNTGRTTWTIIGNVCQNQVPFLLCRWSSAKCFPNMASRILKGKSSGVLKEYFTSPVSTSKSQSTSTSQEFTALLHDAWQTHGRA